MKKRMGKFMRLLVAIATDCNFEVKEISGVSGVIIGYRLSRSFRTGKEMLEFLRMVKTWHKNVASRRLDAEVP